MAKNLTDFFTAVKRLNSKNQEYKKNLAMTLMKQSGVQDGSVLDALQDNPASTQPTTAQAIYHSPEETAKMHYLASWLGLTMRHNSMLVFNAKPDGKDSLYKIKVVAQDPEKMRDILDANGIIQRVIVPNQQEDNSYSILVHDAGRQKQQQVVKAASQMKGEVHETVGEGTFIGDNKFPNKARQQYRQIINEYEQGLR